MTTTNYRAQGMVLAGVGGQGVLTLAQIILDVAWKSGYNVLQSEIHGMSQRGGVVNAHVVFSKDPVTSPIVMEGSGDLLIATEPMEALRYLSYLREDAKLVVSRETMKTISNYPDEEILFKTLESVKGTYLIDTETHTKDLNHRKGTGIILLGAASNFLPFATETWRDSIRRFFASKGDKIIEKNLQAFEFGCKLSKG